MPNQSSAAIAEAMKTACGFCAQQPGEPCIDYSDLANPVILSYVHAERIEGGNEIEAIESGLQGNEPAPLTDAMIDKTGLF